ncbi:MAG: glycoside hydrolase family 78 protein [Bacteroidota bacterium]
MKAIFKSFILLIGALAGLSVMAQVRSFVEVTNLRVEYKENPIGIDEINPRFSWEIKANVRNISQIAYEVRVSLTPDHLRNGGPYLWTTQKVLSDASNQVVYEGPAPKTGDKLYWTVRIWDNQNHITDWAPVGSWEMGLLSPEDWEATWVEAGLPADQLENPCAMFRKNFKLRKEVSSARLYITSHGLYQVELNGKRPNDWLLTPGWTSYNKHLQYQTYDLTDMLQKGENAIGVTVGNGWYRGEFSWDNFRNFYGDKLGVLAQIDVVYADGSKNRIVSDKHWKWNTGPILMSEIYHGETYDARLEIPGWSTAAFAHKDWKPVLVGNYDKSILVAQTGPQVRPLVKLTPVKIFTAPNGDTIADMGQNMVGWIRLEVKGNAGSTITLKHAEVLDKTGNMYYDNLRSARQTISYTLKGGDTEVYEPHFTFQGFRFVKISGMKTFPVKENLTGIVIYSDMAPAGDFACSEPLVNQLQHNIQWGLMSNFVDVPTDCPQRDERMGWTGDAQVFAPTACFNRDAATFYTKWLKDVALDQFEDGRVPHVIPDVLKSGGATGWADVSVVLPWTLYRQYGDKRILERQYASAKAWVDYMKKQSGDQYIWTNGSHFGDWLAYASNASDYPGATTDKDLLATAYFGYSTRLLIQMAEVLGKTDDVRAYQELFRHVRAAFQKEYMTPNGRLSSNTQTAYALALTAGVVPDPMRDSIAARLARDVKRFGHITTGFLGTPLINPVLSEFGYNDLAYNLLLRKEYPSWLYPVTQGATTIWERWDGQKPDGTFQDAGMNSFNHYAYGAIGEWLYSQVAGIQMDPVIPAYKKIKIKPVTGGNLTFARADHETIYGKVSSEWKLGDNILTLNVVIPANTTAEIYVRTNDPDKVTESGKPVSASPEIRFLKKEKGYAVYLVGSGIYSFSCGQ